MELRDWITLIGGGGLFGMLGLMFRALAGMREHAKEIATSAADRAIQAHIERGEDSHPGRWVDWNACRHQEHQVSAKLDRLSDQIQRIDRKLEHLSGIIERNGHGAK